MFSEQLKIEQPFASKLFSAAIKTNKLAQAYMFTQAQAIVQYYFALNIAKILNCQNAVDDIPCNSCTDCKWINNNSHPAIITISPVDFLPSKNENKDGNITRTKNIIKVNQAALIQKELISTSKYHRVIIFMGAKDEKLPADVRDQLWAGFLGRVNPPENTEGREHWVPMHLNYYSFPSETANILLKTIEEPPGNVMFIFITKDTDDMLSTIVSRCQVIPLLRARDIIVEPEEYLQEISSYLPPKNELDSINTAKKLIDYAKTEGISIENLVEYIQIIYYRQLKNTINSGSFYSQLINQIKTIETTKNMLKGYVNPQATLISMLNSLILNKTKV
jgi:DNA polymerase III delta prime subunit